VSAADGAAGTAADGPTGAPAGGAAGAAADGAAPRTGMIWAQARGGVIGTAGTMPWHLPEDLKHFKRTTSGAPVVMGRRTWDSFPPRFRPLPGRTNIVVTRNDSFAADGALRASSLDDGLELARADLARRAADSAGESTEGSAPEAGDVVWVIGGGHVYAEAMAQADLLVVTEIDLEVDGDTHAPAIPEDFTQVEADPAGGWHEAASGLRYRVLTYSR